MLKSVSNRNTVLPCSADCPADNHARQLAQFLYGTLAIMQMNRTIIFFVILSFPIFQCIGQNDLSDNLIEKEIPTSKDGVKDLFYTLTKQKSRQLGIQNMENGYDSLQIRIWYNYPLTNLRELVVLKYTNKKWWGVYYRMNVEWDSSNMTETIVNFDKKFIFPKNGWENLISKLFQKEITELPDMKTIDGVKDYWTDGTTYNIEIGTEKKYRFYSYHLPNKFLEFSQARNMVDILGLIETEFNVTQKEKN